MSPWFKATIFLFKNLNRLEPRNFVSNHNKQCFFSSWSSLLQKIEFALRVKNNFFRLKKIFYTIKDLSMYPQFSPADNFRTKSLNSAIVAALHFKI